MTIVDDDPFALPEESRVTQRQDVIVRGRYMLPQRDGTKKPRGFQRVSNLISAYSDQFGLRMWEIEQTLRGVRADHALYRELADVDLDGMDKDVRKAWVERFMERCKTAAGADIGARFGNHKHAVVEGHHAGLPLGIQNSTTRRLLSLYSDALVRNRLVAVPGMQERRILVESLEVVGTLDNVLEDLTTRAEITNFADSAPSHSPGVLRIGDLKTQRRFWTWLEIGAQLATYAHGDAMWDNELGCWVDMPKVALDVAHVLWMPRIPPCSLGCTQTCEHPPGEPTVQIWDVDIEAGWKTAQRAYEVVKDRASAKSLSNPRARLHPAPPITPIERYAAMFAALDSISEGHALVAEVKRAGLWAPPLTDAAMAAHKRLTEARSTA